MIRLEGKVVSQHVEKPQIPLTVGEEALRDARGGEAG